MVKAILKDFRGSKQKVVCGQTIKDHCPEGTSQTFHNEMVVIGAVML